MEKLFLGQHDGRLGIGHKDEDVAVQAHLVDPVVQVSLAEEQVTFVEI